MLLLWRWRVYRSRLCPATCSVHLGKEHWKSSENPAWNPW
ncbi:hypothetical protein AB205_0017680 [Aquarana catesbeiana]|uniref:Uncharacterized protein n=1 Tax=Aquarana catesbeiana TaxID=8400 RepID=A0A2G9S8C0_AQUCT|nr:hypothetical protein AB205_0017680 [Aquarana catesbeiana]